MHGATIGLFARKIKDDPSCMPEWGNVAEGWDRAGGAGAGAVFKEYACRGLRDLLLRLWFCLCDERFLCGRKSRRHRFPMQHFHLELAANEEM
jgi:hypothetical protein